jgi:hypothetical protein
VGLFWCSDGSLGGVVNLYVFYVLVDISRSAIHLDHPGRRCRRDWPDDRAMLVRIGSVSTSSLRMWD